MQQDPQSSVASTNGASTTGEADRGLQSGALEVNKEFHHLGNNSKITCRIDRVELSKTIGDREASQGASFVVVEFSMRNDGKVADKPDGSDFLIETQDHTTFQVDDTQTYSLTLHRSLVNFHDIFQPVLVKKSLVVFEVPDVQLNKQPVLIISLVGIPRYKVSLVDGSDISGPAPIWERVITDMDQDSQKRDQQSPQPMEEEQGGPPTLAPIGGSATARGGGGGPAPAPAPSRAGHGGGGGSAGGGSPGISVDPSVARSGAGDESLPPAGSIGGEGPQEQGKSADPIRTKEAAEEAFKNSVSCRRYMEDVQRRLKRAWLPPKGNESKTVKVAFHVARDGQTSNLHIIVPSGLPEVDAAALKAVESASPLSPLPVNAPDDLDIEFHFDYNIYNGGGKAGFRQF
jgi:TonB family protein